MASWLPNNVHQISVIFIRSCLFGHVSIPRYFHELTYFVIFSQEAIFTETQGIGEFKFTKFC